MFTQHFFPKGFTLIELMIVIAIIGLLSTSAMVQFDGVRKRSKIVKVQAELKFLMNSMVMAQIASSTYMMAITGSGCTGCPCWPAMSNPSNCVSGWNNALTKIQTVAKLPGLTAYQKDPWGSTYSLDENEYENALNPCGSFDRLSSAGPDKVHGGSDDISILIPHGKCTN